MASQTSKSPQENKITGSHDQAEDRVHRIGQEAESVEAYYLIAAGTIEEDIAELLDSKRVVTTAVLDGEDVPDESLLIALLTKMQQEDQPKED